MTRAQPKKPKVSGSPHVPVNKSISLEERLCDNIAEVSDVYLAYRALERLVSPEYLDEEHENVPVSRAQLGALLHALNAEMQRRIDALERTVSALHAQGNGGGVDTP